MLINTPFNVVIIKTDYIILFKHFYTIKSISYIQNYLMERLCKAYLNTHSMLSLEEKLTKTFKYIM